MLTRVRSAVASLMGGMMAGGSNGDHPDGPDLPLKFPYSRPDFLGLSPDEVECSADHIARPILILKESRRLPWSTGYAEVINAGKSTLNEDQARCEVLVVKRRPSGSPMSNRIPTARRRSSLPNGEGLNLQDNPDVQIEREKASYNVSGGCTALAVVFLKGKLYVGNAGDSRAIIIRAGEIIPMSAEFTPESERQRLQFLAYMQPQLLGNEFTHLEFPRRVQRKEVGKRMLYRDFTMSGWAYKTIEDNDLKFPLIYGEGKKARVLATIGVTRGLGDHNLKVHDSNIYIKPFLSCCPEVGSTCSFIMLLLSLSMCGFVYDALNSSNVPITPNVQQNLVMV
ncbi:protein phosphatase 1H isoform X2 [Austrofundulus limnaeus]|uniref:Protein phosphatase 1H isoform X2 n=1 Tax=Austrofundulus limnaeus TaxID=52670 RepID=A0A2I4CUT2_AUSLI|nr:PREDICTED: protein phosphatase 1H-like isoform X2 [Austrofundulus limnaeus]